MIATVPTLPGSAAHISLPACPPPWTLSLAMCETTLPSFDAFAMSAVKTGMFGLVRLDDRAADRLRVVRREHDRRDLLRDEVLDLTLLLGVVARRVDDVDRVAVLARPRASSRTPCPGRTAPRGSGSRRRSSCRPTAAGAAGGRSRGLASVVVVVDVRRGVRRLGAAGDGQRESARENEGLLHTVGPDAGSGARTPASAGRASELPRTCEDYHVVGKPA